MVKFLTRLKTKKTFVILKFLDCRICLSTVFLTHGMSFIDCKRIRLHSLAHSTCPTYVADFSTGEKCHKIGCFFLSGISSTEHDSFCFSFLIKLLTEVGVLKIEIHLVCFADELFDCSHSMHSLNIFP